MQESEIIKGCIKGDRFSEALLYKQFASKMLGVCLRYFRNRDEAEDCLQEGFIKVYQNIKNYKGDGGIEFWIRKIMINTAINIFKSDKKHRGFSDIEEVKDKISDETYRNDIMSAQHLLKLIQQLPVGYRMVFNLYSIEGYSHKEISLMLNISEGTSKSQLSRARNYLQEKLKVINKTVSSV